MDVVVMAVRYPQLAWTVRRQLCDVARPGCWDEGPPNLIVERGVN